MCEISSKLTIKTPKWRRFGVFIVNFEHISHLCFSVSIVNFKHVITSWINYDNLPIHAFPLKFPTPRKSDERYRTQNRLLKNVYSQKVGLSGILEEIKPTYF